MFYLKLPATVAEKRDVFGSERYEQVAFQQEVEKQFQCLKDKEWVELDASRDIDSLHTEILSRTSTIIGQSADQPIRELWSCDETVSCT